MGGVGKWFVSCNIGLDFFEIKVLEMKETCLESFDSALGNE